MKKNMAVVDRFIRMVIGIVFIILFLTGTIGSPWNYILLAVSVIFIITAVAGTCPLYSLLHMDTRQFK